MRRALLILVALSSIIPFAAYTAPASTAFIASAPGGEATIYRDDYGIPHVFAPTLEAASFAIGYAQAEDRLEELLKNYRRALGTMSEAFGPASYTDDYLQHMFRHAEISREKYKEVSPKMRAVVEAFVDGVKLFMRE